MTSSAVSAIDFGNENRYPENQPRSFRELVRYLNSRPAACWVSLTCYEPQRMVDGWVLPRLANLTNLVLLDRTVVRATHRFSNGSIASLTVTQRRPRPGVDEWAPLLSQSVSDWYSPSAASPLFEKREITLSAAVFVEATEFGDVLLTAGLPATQGVESPAENSSTTLDQCGQAATLTFYMEVLAQAPLKPDPAPP